VSPAGRSWQVVVLAKAPVAGRVKTRLCPPLSPADAARLARAALADTLDAAVASGARRCVLALDGRPGRWLPAGVDVVHQRSGGLGARLAGALEDAWSGDARPMVLVGMDTPQLTAAMLDEAARVLTDGRADTVLGPAEDGGFWAIGVRRPAPGLFAGVPMSTARTGDAQLARAAELGHRCERLAVLRDVDVFADALAVAAQAPSTRFAGEVRRLRVAVDARG